MKKITLFGFMLCLCSAFGQNPTTPPYIVDFNTESEITTDWKYENPTGLGEWIYAPIEYEFGVDGTGCLVFIPSSSNASNNWAFCRPLSLTAGVSYTLSIKYINLFSTPENMAVYIGNSDTSSAMTTQLINIAGHTVSDFTTATIDFTIPSTGTYYVGINDRGTSGGFAGQAIDDFSVVPSQTSNIQEHSEILKIHPNPTSDYINIELPNQKISKTQIYNMNGQLVKEIDSFNDRIDIYDTPQN